MYLENKLPEFLIFFINFTYYFQNMCMKIRSSNLVVYSFPPFSSQSHIRNRMWEVCKTDTQAEENQPLSRKKRERPCVTVWNRKNVEREIRQ